MAALKFYLDLRGKAKDGKGSVLIILSHNNTSTSIATGVRLLPDEWDSRKKMIVAKQDAVALNANLQTQKTGLEKLIAVLSLREDYADMTASEIKRAILGEKPKEQRRHLLGELFSEYIRTGSLKPKTVEIYNITLKKVIAFSGTDMKIEDVTYSWLRSFDKYLSQTQSINGRSIYLRALRSVCNYARKSNIQFRYPFQDFHIKTEETIKRSVSVETLRRFLSVPVSEKESVYRDYFLLMFYLIGINAKDLLLARKSQVVEGRLYYTREKTRKKYSIKIEPEAQILLDRYAGEDYLLEAMDHFKYYKSCLKVINKSLKKIGNSMIPNATTYFTRHCWATFAGEIGIPIDVISQALGHSLGSRTTLVYIRQDPSKVDRANRAVIDYLWAK